MRFYDNKHIETYQKFEKLSRFSFFSNMPNLVLCLISAFLSNTVLVWVDVMVSVGENLHSFLVWQVAIKMRKETGDKYNFGLDRLEVFASFICSLVTSIGMVAVIVGSVISLKTPSSPTSSLLMFCLLKCFNSAYDLYFAITQSRICKEHPSKLNESERDAYRNSLINDMTVGLLAFVCYLLRSHDFVKYFNPIASIILAVFFIMSYSRKISGAIDEITDVSLPIGRQDEIYDIILLNHQCIRKIVSVNCRKLNDKPHIEVSLIFKEDTDYKTIENYLEDIRNKIRKIEENAEIVLVIGKPEE